MNDTPNYRSVSNSVRNIFNVNFVRRFSRFDQSSAGFIKKKGNKIFVEICKNTGISKVDLQLESATILDELHFY